MKSIKFTDKEITQIRKFYHQELETTLRRLEHIKSILAKLDTKNSVAGQVEYVSEEDLDLDVVAREIKTPAKRGRKPKARLSNETVVQYVQPRNSKWTTYIVELLKESNSPMTVQEITTRAIKDFKLPQSKELSTKQAIQNSLFRLRKTNQRIKNTTIPGKKGKFFGLVEWFDKDQLKKEYTKKHYKPLIQMVESIDDI